jgi:hypothetical protein
VSETKVTYPPLDAPEDAALRERSARQISSTIARARACSGMRERGCCAGALDLDPRDRTSCRAVESATSATAASAPRSTHQSSYPSAMRVLETSP